MFALPRIALPFPHRKAFSLWARRARTRRQLAALPLARLADLGLTRGEAGHEAAKPFWRA